MPETASEIRFNKNIGLLLFAVYLAFYGGFVVLVAWDYRLMGREVIGGLNLAVIWGLGLIVGAFILAMVYMGLARGDRS
jgi:uncharacterized membrane protein (DUF485 family)